MLLCPRKESDSENPCTLVTFELFDLNTYNVQRGVYAFTVKNQSISTRSVLNAVSYILRGSVVWTVLGS